MTKKYKKDKIDNTIVLEMYKKGYSVKRIAAHFNQSTPRITTILKRHNIKIDRKGSFYTHEEVYKYFESCGYKLVSTFKRAKKKLECICPKGHTYIVNLCDFKKGHRCKKCHFEQRKLSQEQVFNIFIDADYVVLSEKYIGASNSIEVMCPKGHKSKMNFYHFKNGCRCHQCMFNHQKKESHPYWKPERDPALRDREREIFTNLLIPWKKEIYKRDGYACQRCGGKNCKDNRLEAHHLNGFHWDDKNRLNLNNGITLCRLCHKDFHHKYGRHFNTILQYNKWNPEKPIYNLELENDCEIFIDYQI
jgi:hypothetical protein